MDIKTKYLILGGESGFLGQEFGSEKADGKSSFQAYKHGRIYSSPAGVHVLQGAILKKWLDLKDEAEKAGEKFALGFPISDEREVSDGRGRYSEFENGLIYWSGSTGAHMVAGLTLSKWRVFGGPRGVLGYPIKDPKGDEDQRITEFENGGIFSDKNDAFVVPGEIYKQWLEKEKGPGAGKLGFPRSDELPQPNSKIRFVNFEKGTLKRTVASSGIPAAGIESVPQVIEAHDLTLDQIASAHQTHSGTPGFRVLSLSIYGSPENPLYACVWVKDGGPAQQVLFKAFKKDLPALLNDLPKNDLYPTIVSATGTADSAVFALVTEKRKGPRPVFRSQLVSGPVLVSGAAHAIYTPETFAFWCQWARGNQHILRSACIYGTPESPCYAAIWELNTNEVPWNVAYHDANKNIATNFLAEQDPQLFDEGEMPEITHAQVFWARPSFATRSPHGHQLRVFRADRVGNWVLRENRSLNDYLSDLAEFKPEGFAPICVQGIRVAGKSRFTVILAKRTQPQPRILRAKGQKSSALGALDEAMGEMAQSTGARAASLAIAKNGKLVYARAFTWAEADRRDIQPTDLFRIASCSKPITSVGVYQLVEEKPPRLKSEGGGGLAATPLTNALKNNIKLTPPADVAENFNSITLGQVLAHKAGFRKPVEHDMEKVLNAFKASTLIKIGGFHLPLTMKELASYMATVKLEDKPGAKPIYSNVGFLFLALVIEQALGKSYEQALQERIFKKVGVQRARITESSPNLKDDEVIALDRELRVGRSTVTKERPIVPLEYGTINRDIHPGSGGWVVAPADYVRFLSVLHLGSGTLLKKETVETASKIKANGHSIKKHGGGIVGAVAHIEHMKHKDDEFTFAVFFAINFLGDFENRIRHIIKALPVDAWPDGDLFPSVGIL